MTPQLQPRVNGDLQSVLADHTLLHRLADALGSPVHLVLPDQLERNVHNFRVVYRRHHLRGEVYFAHKANRSHALVRGLAAADAGIDVASLAELQHALGAGFGPERIMVTGPKNRELLWLAARTGATVNADSATELADLAGIVTAYELPRVPVLARLSGFSSVGATRLTRTSRFGIAMTELTVLWETLEKHRDQLDFRGVAYHLDTVGLDEKAAALENCLQAMEQAQQRGLHPQVIDVGGGFGVNYLADGRQWEAWTSELTGAVLGLRSPLTWNDHGYGLRNEGGKVRGTLSVYPAYRPLAGPAYLDRLLGIESPTQRRTLGTLLLDSLFDLHIEPGRALLDQCGATLLRVTQVRDDSGGETLVVLAGNAGDVSMEQHGVLMDPILIPRGEPGPPGPVGVYLLGSLCLEADLITRRKVFLPHPARPGDLLAFANTAGYLMDFSATHALMQPTAHTVAAYRHDGDWQWCLDEQYWPITGRKETR